MAASLGLKTRIDHMKFRMDTESSDVNSYCEVANEAVGRQMERIVITGVKGVHSTVKIAQKMRDSRGMMIVSIKEIVGKDEMRPCIERIKKDCRDHGYDMALVDNEWIMMLPKDTGLELVTE